MRDYIRAKTKLGRKRQFKEMNEEIIDLRIVVEAVEEHVQNPDVPTDPSLEEALAVLKGEVLDAEAVVEEKL